MQSLECAVLKSLNRKQWKRKGRRVNEANEVGAMFTRLADDSAIVVVDRLQESLPGVLFQKMERPEGDDIADESHRIGCHPIQLGWHTPSERVITVRAAILAIIYPRTYRPSFHPLPGVH